MLNSHDILETINMIQAVKISMCAPSRWGFPCLDCCDSDIDSALVTKSMIRSAAMPGHLVKTGEDIEQRIRDPDHQ